jgi:excinuclease ABC subunit A
VIHLADWVIDLGPGGGPEGGEIVYAGPRNGIERESRSRTGAALASRAQRSRALQNATTAAAKADGAG